MLTARENFYEAAKGGNPDRFANEYEAIRLCLHPSYLYNPGPKPGEENVVNAWGITKTWPAGQSGAYPVHSPEKTVIKDIEHWRDYVHAPTWDVIKQEEWEQYRAIYDSVDTRHAFKTVFCEPGIFEMCHFLGGMEDTLINFYTHPDEMHDLIKYITDFELMMAERICSQLHPDAVFHHDDWGSSTSTFMSPAMFEDFYVEAYRQVYGYYKTHGCELIIHHSDSYAATFVPAMIEMGIDVWQGCASSNNIPELVKKYAGKIAFMGGFDGTEYDLPNWNAESIRERVWKYLDQFESPRGFIPSIIQGGPGSVISGVYECIFDAIDDYNVKRFGIKKDELYRLPMQLEKNGFM